MRATSFPDATSAPERGAGSAVELEAVSIREASRLSGIGRTKLYDLIRDGVLPTVRIGRRRLVRPDTMRRVLAGLERTGIEQRRAG